MLMSLPLSQYNRVRDESDDAVDRNYLVLDEVLLLKPPKANLISVSRSVRHCSANRGTFRPQDIPIDFSHLGTLFVLDEDLDGRITMGEASFCPVRVEIPSGLFSPTKLKLNLTHWQGVSFRRAMGQPTTFLPTSRVRSTTFGAPRGFWLLGSLSFCVLDASGIEHRCKHIARCG